LIEHVPPTFAVTAVGVTVILIAPSVVSAVGAAIARAASVPMAVHVGEPPMAVVLAVAPIVAIKEIVHPMLPLALSCPEIAQLMMLLLLMGRFSEFPAMTSVPVAVVPPSFATLIVDSGRHPVVPGALTP
jgi:hypothetical protein